ncbi:MAG: tyrosine-type recombinase/integrase [Acidobacteriia bacterium]|nr:tyrosine-type recombinase/integrase [Terriglobia bacterium]
MNVAIYTRESGTRKYKPASPRAAYSPDTTFCLRYTQDGKRRWEQLDVKSYKEAQAASLKKLTELITESCKQKPDIGTVISRNLNLPAPQPRPLKPIQPSGELMLDAAIDKYIENIEHKSSKTSSGYRYTLQQFYASSGNSLLANVTTQHLYDFVGYLRKEGLGDRTIHNRVGEVVTFLRHFGIKEVTIRIKYVEQKVRAYRPDELKTLFAAATPEEWILFQFFLCTGAREQEVMYAEWNDADFVDGLFTVKAKEHWKPKDYEEREIPLPDFLVAALKKRMLATKGSLIFPQAEGKADGHMLRKLKYLAKRAGLHDEFKLHKFRKTYATLQHKAGVDARTIQKRLGHSDLTTTLAYLEGEDARSDRSRQQVNGTFAMFA